MLGRCEIHPTVPTRNIDRAKSFYLDVLGLEEIDGSEEGGFRLRCGASELYLYPTEFAGTAKHTLLSFDAEDVDSEIDELRTRGVRFEEFDMPGVRYEDGVAWMGDMHGVWFRDPDGNILALFQQTQVPAGVG